MFIKGVMTFLFLSCYTILWCIPLYFFGFLRLISPIPSLKPLFLKGSIFCANQWISGHLSWASSVLGLHWDVRDDTHLHLKKKAWYLVLANHQTWVDPFAIHAALHRRIPFLSFFCKQGVLWIPFINLATYGVSCPILKRYPKALLEKKPELRHKDVESTLRSCRKLLAFPSGIANFSEGTRWTPLKYERQKEKHFQNLLNPKTGGIAYAIEAFGDSLAGILDLTILYRKKGIPVRTVSFWDYCCGRVESICIIIRSCPIPASFKHKHYAQDAQYRSDFKAWLETQWHFKDHYLKQHLSGETLHEG